MEALVKTYERAGRDEEASALEEQCKELRNTVDFGLSEEERKEREELVNRLVRWLKRKLLVLRSVNHSVESRHLTD